MSMDKKQVLDALDKRVFDARTTIAEVCRRANVSPVTVSRWRHDWQRGIHAPTLGRLEDALTEIERERAA
jgi:transposase-like protein